MTITVWTTLNTYRVHTYSDSFFDTHRKRHHGFTYPPTLFVLSPITGLLTTSARPYITKAKQDHSSLLVSLSKMYNVNITVILTNRYSTFTTLMLLVLLAAIPNGESAITLLALNLTSKHITICTCPASSVGLKCNADHFSVPAARAICHKHLNKSVVTATKIGRCWFQNSNRGFVAL